MTAKLYCFGESGNAYKAALTMTLAGYPFETVYVDFFNGEARSPEFLALNVMGEVPVMVEGDMTLSQSGAIQLHVAQATGRLMGKPEDHSEIMRWLFWDNHKGSSQFGPLRFMMNFLPEAKRPQAAIVHRDGRSEKAPERQRHLGSPVAFPPGGLGQGRLGRRQRKGHEGLHRLPERGVGGVAARDALHMQAFFQTEAPY